MANLIAVDRGTLQRDVRRFHLSKAKNNFFKDIRQIWSSKQLAKISKWGIKGHLGAKISWSDADMKKENNTPLHNIDFKFIMFISIDQDMWAC